MSGQKSIMEVASRNMSVNKQAMATARNSLNMQLAQSNPDVMEDSHAVYNLANLLSHAIDVEVITPYQAGELGIELKTRNALSKG